MKWGAIWSYFKASHHFPTFPNHPIRKKGEKSGRVVWKMLGAIYHVVSGVIVGSMCQCGRKRFENGSHGDCFFGCFGVTAIWFRRVMWLTCSGDISSQIKGRMIQLCSKRSAPSDMVGGNCDSHAYNTPILEILNLCPLKIYPQTIKIWMNIVHHDLPSCSSRGAKQ